MRRNTIHSMIRCLVVCYILFQLLLLASVDDNAKPSYMYAQSIVPLYMYKIVYSVNGLTLKKMKKKGIVYR